MSTRSLQMMLSREEFSDVVDETSLASTGAGTGDAHDAADVAVEGKPQAGDIEANALTGEGGQTISAPAKDSAEAETLNELVHAEVAVEAYAGFLKKHVASGISAETAEAIKIGLARHEKVLNKHAPVKVSNENFGGTFSRRQATEQTLEAFNKALVSIRKAKAKLAPKK